MHAVSTTILLHIHHITSHRIIVLDAQGETTIRKAVYVSGRIEGVSLPGSFPPVPIIGLLVCKDIIIVPKEESIEQIINEHGPRKHGKVEGIRMLHEGLQHGRRKSLTHPKDQQGKSKSHQYCDGQFMSSGTYIWTRPGWKSKCTHLPFPSSILIPNFTKTCVLERRSVKETITALSLGRSCSPPMLTSPWLYSVWARGWALVGAVPSAELVKLRYPISPSA